MTGDEEMAARLRLAREKAGFVGPSEASAHFKWKLPTYASHENGWRSYHKSAGKYAKAYRVDEAWLLTGQGKGPEGEVHRRSDGSDALLAMYTELGFSSTQGFFSLPQEGFRQISQILHLLGRQLQHSPLKFLPIDWHSLSPWCGDLPHCRMRNVSDCRFRVDGRNRL